MVKGVAAVAVPSLSWISVEVVQQHPHVGQPDRLPSFGENELPVVGRPDPAIVQQALAVRNSEHMLAVLEARERSGQEGFTALPGLDRTELQQVVDGISSDCPAGRKRNVARSEGDGERSLIDAKLEISLIHSGERRALCRDDCGPRGQKWAPTFVKPIPGETMAALRAARPAPARTDPTGVAELETRSWVPRSVPSTSSG